MMAFFGNENFVVCQKIIINYPINYDQNPQITSEP